MPEAIAKLGDPALVDQVSFELNPSAHTQLLDMSALVSI